MPSITLGAVAAMRKLPFPKVVRGTVKLPATPTALPPIDTSAKVNRRGIKELLAFPTTPLVFLNSS